MSKIKIPKYTLKEELINAISHGLGAVFGIVALVLTILVSVKHKSTLSIVCASIYGSSLIILYLISCLYHSFSPNLGAKKVFRVLDHCSIYLLILGSYTPFLLICLNRRFGIILFLIMIILSITCIVLNAVDIEKFRKVSMFSYLALGWLIILPIKQILSFLPTPAVLLLVLGGVVYTIGAVIFLIGGRVKYMHSLWHIFVLVGSILHFLCIYLYVL